MTATLHTQQRIKQITDLASNCVLFKLKMLASVTKPTLDGSEKVDPSVRWTCLNPKIPRVKQPMQECQV